MVLNRFTTKGTKFTKDALGRRAPVLRVLRGFDEGPVVVNSN